jgi:hypothetical protein
MKDRTRKPDIHSKDSKIFLFYLFGGRSFTLLAY